MAGGGSFVPPRRGRHTNSLDRSSLAVIFDCRHQAAEIQTVVDKKAVNEDFTYPVFVWGNDPFQIHARLSLSVCPQLRSNTVWAVIILVIHCEKLVIR